MSQHPWDFTLFSATNPLLQLMLAFCELTWTPQWPSNKPAAVDRKLTSTKLILKWVSSTRSANVSALLRHFVYMWRILEIWVL